MSSSTRVTSAEAWRRALADSAAATLLIAKEIECGQSVPTATMMRYARTHGRVTAMALYLAAVYADDVACHAGLLGVQVLLADVERVWARLP